MAPIFHSCCGCCDLKTGCGIISIYILVQVFSQTCNAISRGRDQYRHFFYDLYNSKENYSSLETKESFKMLGDGVSTDSYLAVSYVSLALLAIGGTCLLIAVLKEKPHLVLAYIGLHTLSIIIDTLNNVIIILLLLLPMLVIALLDFYFIVIAYSYYEVLQNPELMNRGGVIIAQHPTQVVQYHPPQGGPGVYPQQPGQYYPPQGVPGGYQQQPGQYYPPQGGYTQQPPQYQPPQGGGTTFQGNPAHPYQPPLQGGQPGNP